MLRNWELIGRITSYPNDWPRHLTLVRNEFMALCLINFVKIKTFFCIFVCVCVCVPVFYVCSVLSVCNKTDDDNDSKTCDQ